MIGWEAWRWWAGGVPRWRRPQWKIVPQALAVEICATFLEDVSWRVVHAARVCICNRLRRVIQQLDIIEPPRARAARK